MRLSVVDNFQSLSFNDSRSCVHETQFNPKIDSLSMNTAFCWFTVKNYTSQHNTKRSFQATCICLLVYAQLRVRDYK